jgi:gliding motility-associated-like protein
MKEILRNSLVLISLFGSTLFNNLLHATHVAGGEITVENIANDQFLLSLSFYRDCTGIPFNDVSATINVTSTCIPDFNVTLFLTNPGGTEVSQVCPADIVNSACNGGPIQGMEEYVFQGIVNLPINCTDYTFSYQEFARNPSINIIGAGGEFFYVDATLNTTLFPNNSTPFFTSPPIPYVCENQTVNYNYGVVEADGDSLAYSLVAARGIGFGGNPTPVTYNAPTYSAASPFPGITINPNTGELNFTPLGPSGNYIVVVRVDEYNGVGQLISSIHRDIQFVVLPCSNQIPTVPATVANVTVGGGTVNQTAPLEITAEVGSSFCFDVTFSDVNPADEVFVFNNANSALPGSVVTESGINPKTVTLCWTVPQGTNTNNTVLFQAADSACPISGVNSVAVQIVVPPPPALNLNLRFVNEIRCNGNCEGTIVADVFGGSGFYSYNWQPQFSPGGDQNFQGQGTDSIWNVCGGQQYQLQVTDLNDPDPSTNTIDTVFFFVEPTKMEFQQKTMVNDDCDASTCNGSITVNVIFGSGNKTYLWNDGSTAQVRTNLCPGIYNLTVTDDSNCVLTETFHITRPTPFGLSLDSIDSVTCFGGNDGAIYTSLDISCGPSTKDCMPAIIGTIGTGATFNTTTTYPSIYGNFNAGARHQMLYTKSELDAAGVEDIISSIAFNILSQGNQDVFDGFTIKMGCTSVADLSGGYVANLDTVFFSKRITTSLGWNTHDLDVSYGWDGSSNIVVEVCFNNTGAESFGNNVMALTNTPFVSTRWFSANNANVCSSGATSGTTNSRPDIRFGHCTNDFTFDWDPAPAAGQNDSIVTGLTAQQYTVSVTTDEGCVVVDTFVVEEPPELIGVITETRSIRCAGECNGELRLNISGGIPFSGGFGYTIAWSDGLPSDTVQTGLCAQNYTVTITDRNNCQEIVSYDLDEPDSIVANTVIVSPVSCNGDCDGVAQVIPGGGSPPYDITWPSGNKNQTDTALCAGTYDVTILDDSLCQLIVTVEVSEPDPLIGTLSSLGAILCNGDSNLTLLGSATGGTLPYNFLWLPSGATGPTLPGQGAGTDTLIISDSRGCTDTLDTTILEPPLLEVTIVETGSIGCAGATTGELTANPSGGTPNYFYNWNNGPTTQINPNLGVGTYTVTVTDNNGCTATDTYNLSEPPPIIPIIDTLKASCFGVCDGIVSVSMVPAANFAIAWPAGVITVGNDTAINLCAGTTYDVTITDLLSLCDTVYTVGVPSNAPFIGSIVEDQGILCNGDITGQLTANISGGTPGPTGYSYLWNTGATTATISGLGAGNYIVTVTDFIGCDTVMTYDLLAPDPLVGSLSGIGTILCNGDNTVTLTGSAVGGTAPYSFLWLPSGATGPTLPGQGAGTDTLIISDSRGCTDTLDTTILEPPLLEVTIVETGSIGCAGATTGELTANPSGGTPNYFYNWNNGPTTQINPNLGVGTYTVTVTDNNGCTATDTYNLSEPPPIIPTIDTLKASCFGVCDGIVSVSMVPAANFAIAWPAGVITVGNDTAINLCAGTTYDVTITDLLSLCDTVYTVGVPSNAPFIGSIVEDQGILCNGDITGQLTANISGGTPGPTGYSYLWNTGATTATISGLGAGNYIVTVTDFIGCDTVMTYDLLAPDPLVGSLSGIGTILCNGDNTVTLTGSAVGGTAPYSFLWLPSGATGPTLPGLGAGTYMLVVIDSGGCTDTLDTTILEPPLLEVTIVETGSIGCAGATTGELTANPSGGTPNYFYNWNNGPTTQINPNLGVGTYTVTVTDNNGCTATDTYNLDDPPDIIPVIETNKLPCPGTCDGQVAVYMNPSTNFLVSWPVGVTLTGDTANNLCAGTDYLVTITDTLSLCDTVYTINIPENPAFGGGITEDQGILCNGDASGQLTANPTGGSPPYSYLWNNGGITPTISGLIAGTYTVTITDTNGCDTIMTQVLLQPDPVVASLTGAGTILCNGDNTVTLSASATGGNGGYTFLWLPSGATGPVLPNIGAGTYFLIAYDADSCASDTIDTTILEPSLLEVTIVETGSIGCAGATTGELTANPTGGTPNYFYNWSNGPSTQINPNLGVGTYIVTVTDINGCTATDTYDLDDPPDIIPAIDTLKASCQGTCDGSVVVSMTPAANFTITWPAGVVVVGNSTAINLCAGTTYDVTITDVNSLCDTVYTVGVPENNPFIGSINEDQSILCNGDLSGQLTASISGGTPGITGYGYLWNTGDITPTISGLGAGVFTVTVTDSIGCDTVMTYNLTEPTPIVGIISVQNPISCNDSCDGALLMVASGGTPPLTIEWSNGDLGPIAGNLCQGTYDVTITDNNSCQLIQSFNLTDPDPITPSISVTDATCGNQNGSIDLLPVSGGNGGPYDYAWNISPNPGNIPTVGGLGFGVYTVTITNQGGSCPEEFNIPLSEIGGPDTTLFELIEPLCFDSCNGLIRATPVGGVGPFSYLWSSDPLDTLDSITSVCQGQYFITVTDANNCSRVDTVTLNQPDLIVTTPSVTDPTCFGGTNGSISVTSTGGNPFSAGLGYVYAWSNGAGNVSVNPNLTSGTYLVTTQDSTGCQVVNSIDVIDPAPINLTLSITEPLCTDDCNGSAFVIATGGAGGFSYAWSNGDIGDTARGLCGGVSYTLTVTDQNNCSADTTFTLPNPARVTIDNISILNPTCGEANGRISAAASGGTGSFIYIWFDGVVSDTINPKLNVAAGNYRLVVIDGNGCSDTAIVPVSNVGGHTVELQTTPAGCDNSCIGTATAVVTGGSGNYTFTWSDGINPPFVGAQTLTDLCSGENWFVTVTDVGIVPNCIAVDNGTIQGSGSLLLSFDVVDNNQCLSTPTCIGSATVSASGGAEPYTFLWSTGDTTSTISGLCGNATYFVTVSSQDGCSTEDSVFVDSIPAPSITIDTVISSTCLNTNDGAIQISVAGGTSPYEYNWTGPGFSSNLEDISNLLPGLYRITVTDDSGCEILDSVQVDAENIVVVRIDNLVACSESEDDQLLAAIVDGGTGPSQYQWFDDQGLPISNDSAIQVGYPVNDTDFYRVEIINSGCSASDVGYVIRGQAPDVDAGPDETILNGESIEIGGNPTSSVAGSTFNWTPSLSLNNAEAANPFATPEETTLYAVVVTDQLGCQNTDSVVITVVNAFEVPSGITPNGDGKNDVWELDFIEKYPNARVIVINRWGQEVFSSDGYEVPWDGTMDGSQLPVGTYYYIIDLKTDLLEPLTGPITIMR